MKLSIKEIAEKLGVTTTTIRNWSKIGKIQSERTKGGHRRFDVNELIDKHITKLIIKLMYMVIM